MWLYYPNPYGITQGSGSIDMSYTGSSSFGWTTNLNGLNTAGVVAYPNISYGRSLFSATALRVSRRSFRPRSATSCRCQSNVAYTITDNEVESHNIDVLFDEWVTTDSNTLYTDIGHWLEVGVFPYLDFPGGYAGALVKTFQEPVTLNGTATTISFYEYSASSGTCSNNQCGQAVFFYAVPDQKVASGEIAFDMLDFIKEAVTTSGIAGLNYVQAHQLGTEFGGSSEQNFSFTMSKFGFETGPAGMPHCNRDPSASGLDLSRADHVELSCDWCRRKSDHQIFHHPQSQQDERLDRTARDSERSILAKPERAIHDSTARIVEGRGQLRAHRCDASFDPASNRKQRSGASDRYHHTQWNRRGRHLVGAGLDKVSGHARRLNFVAQ